MFKVTRSCALYGCLYAGALCTLVRLIDHWPKNDVIKNLHLNLYSA